MIGWLARWWHLRLQRRQVSRWRKDVDYAVRRWEKAQKAVSLHDWTAALHRELPTKRHDAN